MPLPFTLKVHIIPGRRKIGHKLGFPTLNFKVNEEVEIPKFGVYAGYVNKFPAVIHWGPRETFGLEEPSLEAHLLDFEEEWGHEKAELGFISYLRDVQKFASEEELKKQIERDILQARKTL